MSEWVEKIPTGESRNTRGIPYPNATLFITNPTCAGPGLNSSLSVERAPTGLLNYAALCSLEVKNLVSGNYTDENRTYKSDSRPTGVFIHHAMRNEF
jgi:hypothetical protein